MSSGVNTRDNKLSVKCELCGYGSNSHLGDDLCESTTGLVTNPHFVLGAMCRADGLELGVDRLVRERVDAQLRLAGGVQLQVVSQCGIRKTL